jgi:hypothetical protein
MRDWFSAGALYIPAWILLGALMGIWGPHDATAIAIWILASVVVASFGWRAGAGQAKQSREIHENLGKLVRVTEPSPVNILTAAAAKILTLESEINAVKRQQPRRLNHDQIEAMSAYFESVPREERSGITILVHKNNPEATQYGRDLDFLFRNFGLAHGLQPDSGIGRDLVGVIIRVKDDQSRPPIAKHLSEALTRAKIEHRIEALSNLQFGFAPKTDCQLVLGRNG